MIELVASVIPQEASVSQLDCTFDHGLCKWTVDSRSFEAPTAANKPLEEPSTVTISSASEVPEKEGITTPVATTPTIATSTTTMRSTVREEEAPTTAITDPSVALSVTDDMAAASAVTEETSPVVDVVTEQTPDADLATTIIQTAESEARTSGATVESNSIRGTGEVFFLNFPGKSDEASKDIASTPSTTTDVPTTEVEPPSTPLTTEEPLVVVSSTPSPNEEPGKLGESPTRPASKLITLPGNKSKQPVSVVVGESVKNGTLRRVGGLYDEVTSFGANTIEVISTSRDGATKSIIISQPVKTRFRRDTGEWRGYNRFVRKTMRFL